MEKRLASGIGVWFEQEIENALRAVDLANEDVASLVPTAEMQIYRRGYVAAINALAATFGVNYRTGDVQDSIQSPGNSSQTNGFAIHKSSTDMPNM